ncbi:transglycosylase SLT domain-containing protein [Candidatus Peregrinibacteria bacterium]|nr:transglycosylase SLT domain-containing protein [Candidatus Peregrinibacteria bacterium]
MIDKKLKIIGENRLVFATQKPAEAPPQTLEAPTGQLSALNEDIADDPNKLADSIRRLGASWEKLGKSFDGLKKLFEPLGVDEEEIEATLREPGANPDSADTDEPEPSDWLEKQKTKPSEARNVSFKDYKSAEEASQRLKEHSDWMDWIKEAAQKYNIPVSTIVAFIRKESGFNPRSKCSRSSASGLAQAMEGTWKTYQIKTGQPNADRFNPKDAIDFVGWECKDLINTVNRKIDREGLPPEYKLNGLDVKHLYVAYNQGPTGYLLLRVYLDNPTAANFKKLRGFQQEIRGYNAEGKPIYGWEKRTKYAESVANVAQAYERTA